MSKRGHSGRGSRFEISTNTRDPSLQLVFADPYGTLTQLGLSIPSAIPTAYPKPYANRYLALLVSAKFEPGEVVRLVGMRQRVLIGLNQGGTYPIYKDVTTPEWHFTDANISWHLRRVALEGVYNRNVFNRAESMFRTSGTPSILFEKSPLEVGGYAPPNGGQPPGNVVIPEFGNFHDVRFPWVDDHAWDSLDIEVRGPCAINFYASIQQTDPDTRPTLSGLTDPQIAELVPEERFLQRFPSAIYTRIAGSLIFEEANLYPEPVEMVDCTPDCPPKCAKHKKGRKR